MKKAIVYTPDRGTEGLKFEVGKDNVQDITSYKAGVLQIRYDDNTVSLYHGMPFELHVPCGGDNA